MSNTAIIVLTALSTETALYISILRFLRKKEKAGMPAPNEREKKPERLDEEMFEHV